MRTASTHAVTVVVDSLRSVISVRDASMGAVTTRAENSAVVMPTAVVFAVTVQVCAAVSIVSAAACAIFAVRHVDSLMDTVMDILFILTADHRAKI